MAARTRSWPRHAAIALLVLAAHGLILLAIQSGWLQQPEVAVKDPATPEVVMASLVSEQAPAPAQVPAKAPAQSPKLRAQPGLPVRPLAPLASAPTAPTTRQATAPAHRPAVATAPATSAPAPTPAQAPASVTVTAPASSPAPAAAPLMPTMAAASGAVSSAAPASAARASASTASASTSADTASPVPRVQLPSSDAEYLNNRQPPYPPLSNRLREQGTVVIRVFIDVAGNASQAELHTSSGYDRLDRIAQSTVATWRFVPGTVNGEPKGMWFNVPVRFTLK